MLLNVPASVGPEPLEGDYETFAEYSKALIGWQAKLVDAATEIYYVGDGVRERLK